MKFPIRCMSCGNTGSVSANTLAKAASGNTTLRCNACRSSDIDLDTATPKTAAGESTFCSVCGKPVDEVIPGYGDLQFCMYHMPPIGKRPPPPSTTASRKRVASGESAACWRCGRQVEHVKDGWGALQFCDQCDAAVQEEARQQRAESDRLNNQLLGAPDEDTYYLITRFRDQQRNGPAGYNVGGDVYASLNKVAISDAQVRSLAAAWHGGQSSPLYALTSSGAIVEGCAEEIEENLGIAQVSEPADVPALKALLDYVRLNGPRGPQQGWSDKWDDSWQTLAAKTAGDGWSTTVTQGMAYSKTINGYFCVLDNSHGLTPNDGWRWSIYESYRSWNYGNTPEDTSGSVSMTWEQAVAEVTERASSKPRVSSRRTAGQFSSDEAAQRASDAVDAAPKCSRCGHVQANHNPSCVYQGCGCGSFSEPKSAAFKAVLRDILSTNPGLDRRVAQRVANKTVQVMEKNSARRYEIRDSHNPTWKGMQFSSEDRARAELAQAVGEPGRWELVDLETGKVIGVK